MATVVSQVKVKKSRKEHICNYCRGKIRKGDPYRKSFLTNDGETYEWKEHESCHEVAKELFWSGFFEDEGDGMSAEDFGECVKELYEEFFPIDFKYSIQFKAKELAKLLKTHKLVAIRPNGYTTGWKMVEIKNEVKK
ncbi:hypothetical protein KCG48_10560 [Proteiniclasticum sp. BAD-10]|uniref:Uncharacterized protein n=1 Tax=Proteiniclasticum sediminis TaxID=2804028 RepID=A0A941CRG1_9CLOT|nr:hypothetical protein [Proteiniclasticum sediminis]MBR0576774.1 hypothetical protein [Proteiniclasticum sediminis]